MSYPIGDIELAASAGNNELQNMSGGDDMSLTDKEKGAALDCFERLFPRHGDEFCVDMGTIPASKVAEAFGEFLSRIRDEQESAGRFVTYQGLHLDVSWRNRQPDDTDYPLFTTPTAAQCDCEELVEVLEFLRERLIGELGYKIDEALANHAKHQQSPSAIKVGDTCNGPWPTIKGESDGYK